jgi:ribonuclease BN (tRNA processing enzyme)
MELTVIGSGTVTPSATRHPAAYLLQQDGFRVLLDAGPGTLSQLARLGVSPGDLDAVVLTHLHPDHALDLVHLLFHRGVCGPGERREELLLVGPSGFQAELEGWLRAIHPGTLEENTDLVWQESGAFAAQIGPWQAHAVPLAHRTSSPSGAVGYHIESNRGVLSYTGDSSMCPGLTQLLDHRGCLICECTSPDRSPTRGHLTPAQVRRLAERNLPELLVLSHVGPEFEDGELPGEAFHGYPGRVALAEDGMMITFDSGYIRSHY